MKNLKQTLWKVATEYAMKVGELIELEPEFWVAEDISVDCCCFGDVWFLTLEEMQVIIDHMPKWLERYGNRKAVAQEITDWLDWSIEDGYDPDRDQYRRHARLTELEARKRIEDESTFEKIKDTEAYKHFRKMVEGEA